MTWWSLHFSCFGIDLPYLASSQGWIPFCLLLLIPQSPTDCKTWRKTVLVGSSFHTGRIICLPQSRDHLTKIRRWFKINYGLLVALRIKFIDAFSLSTKMSQCSKQCTSSSYLGNLQGCQDLPSVCFSNLGACYIHIQLYTPGFIHSLLFPVITMLLLIPRSLYAVASG